MQIIIMSENPQNIKLPNLCVCYCCVVLVNGLVKVSISGTTDIKMVESQK